MAVEFLFVCLVLLGSGVSSQDSETTPFPQVLTSFTCHGRQPGYYADLETGCRTYHVCDGISHFTYICPRRTLFQQKNRICDHAYRVQCDQSELFFLTENTSEEELVPVEQEDTLSTKGNIEYYEQTDEFAPTETTPFSTELPKTLPTTPPTTIKTPTAVTTLKATTATKNLTTTEETTITLEEENPVQKFLKFSLKDFRSLFFIPEFENNSIVANPEKELVLPLEKNDFLIFKSRREGRSSFPSCPTYCNPKFFLPGTCHPCIMIK